MLCEFIDVDRLREIAVEAGLDEPSAISLHRLGGHGHGRYVGGQPVHPQTAQGFYAAHIRQPKTDRLRLVGTGTEIVPIDGRITSLDVAERLRACDVVFGCIDKERGRAGLNRFAYRYLTPVIDTAFIIESINGQLRALIGRVTSLPPGQPCLLCRGRIDPERMRIEGLPQQQSDMMPVAAPGATMWVPDGMPKSSAPCAMRDITGMGARTYDFM